MSFIFKLAWTNYFKVTFTTWVCGEVTPETVVSIVTVTGTFVPATVPISAFVNALIVTLAGTFKVASSSFTALRILAFWILELASVLASGAKSPIAAFNVAISASLSAAAFSAFLSAIAFRESVLYLPLANLATASSASLIAFSVIAVFACPFNVANFVEASV